MLIRAIMWKTNDWWRTNKECAANVDLWKRLLALCETQQVEFIWIKGHAGNVENERCDQLSMTALRQPGPPADEGYESRPETEGVRPRSARRRPMPEIFHAGHQADRAQEAGARLLLRVLSLLSKVRGHLHG